MKEFIKQDGNIIMNAPYAEAYIPVDLFRNVDKESEITSAVAYDVGETINVVGVFNMRFMPDEFADRDKYPLRTFVYPSPIDTRPSKTSYAKLKLTNHDDAEDDEDAFNMRYRVLQYYKGDIMMSASKQKSVANCEKLLAMISRGYIPNTIPYSHLVEIWAENFEINDVNSGVPSVTMQCIIAEQCRYSKNPRIPFRKIIGTGKAGETDYMMANMRTVASYNSTFSALTFEDMGQMLTSSINMTRSGTPQVKSPIEKVLTY